MSAETDIAAIDTAGANTASEMRTALTSIYNHWATWTPTLYTNTPTQFTTFTVDYGWAMRAGDPGAVVLSARMTMSGAGTLQTIRSLPAVSSGYQYDTQEVNILNFVGMGYFYDDSAGTVTEYTMGLGTDGYVYFHNYARTVQNVTVASADIITVHLIVRTIAS